MAWVYVQSEANLWTVGHYAPDGKWHGDSDHTSPEKAAERVHYLNGGAARDEAARVSRGAHV